MQGAVPLLRQLFSLLAEQDAEPVRREQQFAAVLDGHGAGRRREADAAVRKALFLAHIQRAALPDHRRAPARDVQRKRLFGQLFRKQRLGTYAAAQGAFRTVETEGICALAAL